MTTKADRRSPRKASTTAQHPQKSKQAHTPQKRRSRLQRPRNSLPSLAELSTKIQQDIPEPLPQIHSHAKLLQQLYIRHKNQHRGQIWFKQLNLLRRAINDLLEIHVELFKLQSSAQSLSGVTAEKVRSRFERRRELESKEGELGEWIRERLLAECYVRFSALIADGDGSFANLGVVLVGVVAGVGRVVGMPSEIKSDGQMEERVRVGGKGLASDGLRRRHDELEKGQEMLGVVEVTDDFGTVVYRNEVELEHTKTAERGDETSNPVPTEDGPIEVDATKIEDTATTVAREAALSPNDALPQHDIEQPVRPKVKRKSRTRKGNAIDDLFKGFA